MTQRMTKCRVTQTQGHVLILSEACSINKELYITEASSKGKYLAPTQITWKICLAHSLQLPPDKSFIIFQRMNQRCSKVKHQCFILLNKY